jgi:hypothetical protein
LCIRAQDPREESRVWASRAIEIGTAFSTPSRVDLGKYREVFDSRLQASWNEGDSVPTMAATLAGPLQAAPWLRAAL